MKIDTIFESPFSDLPIDAQKHIADDMEDISRLAMNVSNAIYSGTMRDYEAAIEEFQILVKRTMSQIRQ